MNKNNIDISFITINYNSSRHTINLINSIKENSLNISYEIIVVDNASQKDDFLTLKEFVTNHKDILLIRNCVNSGFSSGNMIGVNYSRAKYYFFINNDCILLNNTAKILKDFLDFNDNVALCTAKILDENGDFSSSYKQFPHILKQLLGNSIQRKLYKYKFPSNKIKLNYNSQVEVISGSCMFFRAKDFCNIGGFDTVFFLYCEEEDICKRIWDYGKKIYFIPEAKLIHKSGGSTNKNFEIEREFYISYYHLIEKHHNLLGQYIIKTILFFKLFFRVFKKRNGLKIFLFMINGFSNKFSLRYNQKLVRLGE
ncbi:glycosyltransferase family 2 protein [Aliarcobacter lanthieri]|uniref:glycosyltransferase family 2 protein n=1 Tax=Aliarcobacter lanthieri TaxID=1355374 RepID=UPI00069077E2|nr:glycosyltransferase family 2 protein [Aliarcobacter lanthieri]QKF59854.1 glycosyltransferase, family 2 [Aliarcobacter lanthieri]